jgi:dihydrofolate synthase / folylpolyglutamate synthase
MTMIDSEAAASALMFASYERVQHKHGYDQDTRDLTAMRDLFAQANIPTRLPDPHAPIITVTGSKGKGSTALLCGALLQSLGYRVGLLTSPHMLHLRERVRVDGRMIDAEAYTQIIADLAPHIRALDAALPAGKYLSPTGLFLALAMRHFVAQACTALVLEVGRGGRYDDVRLIDNTAAAITPIMGEHLDKLGPTTAEVAWHKSGIIKRGNVVSCAPQSAAVDAIIAQEAVALGAQVWRLGAEVTLQAHGGDGLTITTPRGSVRAQLHTPARYQQINVGVAAGAVLGTVAQHAPDRLLDDTKDARTITGRLRLPGRCERVASAPAVWVDGAINGTAAVLFADSVRAAHTRPCVLVTALPSDKDAAGVFAALGPLVDQIIITHVSAAHLHFDDAAVTAAARAVCANVTHEPTPATAFARAVNEAGTAGTVYGVGTQSLVRDALQFWHSDLTDLYAPHA